MIISSLSLLKKSLFNIIAPPFCVQCRVFLVEDKFLCNSCLAGIAPVATKTIPITEKYSAKVFAISDYGEPLRSLVLAKHYGNRLAAKQIGRLMWERTDLRFADFDIIVPVPLHWTRYAWRWFNQAEVIAQELSIKSGKPVVHLLKRVKLTQYQTGLTRHKRLTNLNGAFELTDQAKQFEDKKILLIDDVMTTGTTLHRCFRAIIKMQPKSLKAGVACRTL